MTWVEMRAGFECFRFICKSDYTKSDRDNPGRKRHLKKELNEFLTGTARNTDRGLRVTAENWEVHFIVKLR
jgi:hypothetical protein